MKNSCSSKDTEWKSTVTPKTNRKCSLYIYTQSFSFSSGHVWMWELEHKGWEPKNRCFWTVVLESLESPLDSKEIQPVHPKGDQSWVFIGRTDAEAETPVLWQPDAKNCLTGKNSDDKKDWRQGRRRWQRIWLHYITDSMDSSLCKLWEFVIDRKGWRAAVHGITQRVGHDWVTELKT